MVVTLAGHVLTNQHVVRGCTSLAIRTVGGAERTAELLAEDGQNDLALLKARSGFPAAAAFRTEPPRLGEAVVAYGFPLSGVLASSGNVSQGIVSALAGIGDDSRAVQISAPVQPGNSGGPLLDGSGLLVGVIQSKLDALRAARATGDIAQNVNFAIRGSLAAEFLGQHQVRPASEHRHADRAITDVTEHAQRVTVRVICYGAPQ